MWQSDYQFFAAFESTDGERLGDARLDVDWVPAVRWAEFERSVMKDGVSESRSAQPVIEPVWSPQGEPPYVCGVTIGSEAAANVSVRFPLHFFTAAVVAASSQLVASGAMDVGQRFDYKVFALANTKSQENGNAGFEVVAVDEPPTIDRADLALYMAEAEVHSANGAASDHAPAMPIFIPQRVLDEATGLAERSGDIETGGVLVGKLCRDSSGELFTRVTAQIPAQHTTGTRESLQFTPETWAAVDAAIRLRGMNEIALGWWHHHGFFCRQCPPERRALCPFSLPTFSAADRALHREVYQKSWSIALLLSFLGEERPSYDVFGWNRGEIEALNFHTLPHDVGSAGVES